MKWLYLSLGILTALLMTSGCAGKNVYEPKKVDAEVKVTQKLDRGVKNVVREGAVLDKKDVVTRKSGVITGILPKGFYFINESEGNIIVGNDDGKLEIISKSTKKPLFTTTFEQPVVSATQKGNLLAAVLSDNTIVLYDIKADSERYRESLDKVITIDARAANPVFINDLIVFPTLDGRLLIMDSNKKVVLRDVAISDKELFNNVIFLEVHGNILVAATSSKVIVITPKRIYTYAADIKDILYVGHNIYIFTKGGKVIQLNEQLQKVEERDFEYANFVAVAEMNGKLYGVEREGYLIEMDRKLGTVNIKALDDEVEQPSMIAKDVLYIGDKAISLK
jgi:outer membrane protein assembly factor BamB